MESGTGWERGVPGLTGEKGVWAGSYGEKGDFGPSPRSGAAAMTPVRRLPWQRQRNLARSAGAGDRWSTRSRESCSGEEVRGRARWRRRATWAGSGTGVWQTPPSSWVRAARTRRSGRARGRAVVVPPGSPNLGERPPACPRGAGPTVPRRPRFALERL